MAVFVDTGLFTSQPTVGASASCAEESLRLRKVRPVPVHLPATPLLDGELVFLRFLDPAGAAWDAA